MAATRAARTTLVAFAVAGAAAVALVLVLVYALADAQAGAQARAQAGAQAAALGPASLQCAAGQVVVIDVRGTAACEPTARFVLMGTAGTATLAVRKHVPAHLSSPLPLPLPLPTPTPVPAVAAPLSWEAVEVGALRGTRGRVETGAVALMAAHATPFFIVADAATGAPLPFVPLPDPTRPLMS